MIVCIAMDLMSTKKGDSLEGKYEKLNRSSALPKRQGPKDPRTRLPCYIDLTSAPSVNSLL